MGVPVEEAATEMVERWLDKAVGVDWHTVDDDCLVHAVEAAIRTSAKLDALRARLADALDRSGVAARRGHGNTTALLATVGHNRPRRDAYCDVRHGRRLTRMPHVAEAYRAGLICIDHVQLFGECLHRRFAEQFADFEQQLVEYAIELTFEDFVRLIERWKDYADDTWIDDREAADRSAREVHLSRSFQGRGILSGTLTPLARSIVDAELQRLSRQLFDEEWAEALETLGEGNVSRHDLRRTAGQRRHDALLLMAQPSASRDGGTAPAEPMVYVHCSEAEAAAALEVDAGCDPSPVSFADAVRELDDGTRISRSMLVRLMVRAQLRRVVWGPGREILQFGRRRRFFSGAQREALAIRDRVCSCGCGLPARSCDADHVVEWSDGGATDLANSQPLCRAAHSHKTGAAARRRPGGTTVSGGALLVPQP
jgi:hypothetical protein